MVGDEKAARLITTNRSSLMYLELRFLAVFWTVLLICICELPEALERSGGIGAKLTRQRGPVVIAANNLSGLDRDDDGDDGDGSQTK